MLRDMLRAVPRPLQNCQSELGAEAVSTPTDSEGDMKARGRLRVWLELRSGLMLGKLSDFS